MRLYNDSLDITEVQWYFVPDNTAGLPYETVFGSAIYDRSDAPEPVVGEQYVPHPWQGGLPPVTAGRGGLCGTASQWRNGALTTDPVPAFWPGSAIPVCCSDPIGALTGGIDLPGSFLVEVLPPPPPPCGECVTFPTTYLCTFAGWSNDYCPFDTDCNTFNSTVPLTNSGGCDWVYQAPVETICGIPVGWFAILRYFTNVDPPQWGIFSDLPGLSLAPTEAFQCFGITRFAGSGDYGTLCNGDTITAIVSPG